MTRILIDTDAGIDDSVAILYANSLPDVEIAAITTVFGTASLENTTRNVLNLADFVGMKPRVARGRGVPILAEPMPVGGFHGPTGVGSAQFPPSRLQADEAYAWDVIYEEAKKGGEKLTVVTLGPLTNLAIALMKYEDLKDYIEKIVIMGGSLDAGNADIHTEANIWHDPHACEVVFRCGAPIVMAGLNATECTRLTTAEWNRLFSRRTKLWRVLRDMFATYKHSQNSSGETGLVIHDAAAMLLALRPETGRCERHWVHCETTPGPNYGRTVVDLRFYAPEDKNVDVAMEIDKGAFLQAMEDMLTYYEALQ